VRGQLQNLGGRTMARSSRGFANARQNGVPLIEYDAFPTKRVARRLGESLGEGIGRIGEMRTCARPGGAVSAGSSSATAS